MFKREMKINFRSFVMWSFILIMLFLVVFLVYPSLIKGENMKMISEMMNIFPEDILKTFNMDIASIDTAFGWFKSEGFVFVLLITGVYSGLLGANILLKEEDDKTIEYLNSLPITRKHIVIIKYFCGLVYIFLIILTLGIFNYVGLTLSGDFDRKLFALLSITPLFSSFVIFSLCMFLSTFAHKSKKITSLSLGIVFVSYFINVISELSDDLFYLRYFSVFTLADIRNVIIGGVINPWMVIISVMLTVVLFIAITITYDNKELF